MDEGQTQKGNGMLFSPLFSHPSFRECCLPLCLIPRCFSLSLILWIIKRGYEHYHKTGYYFFSMRVEVYSDICSIQIFY